MKKITKNAAYRKRRAREADELEALLHDLQRSTLATDTIGTKAIYHGAKLLAYLRQWEAE